MRTSRVYAVLSVALAGVACSDNTTAPTAEWTATMDITHESPVPTGTTTLTGTVVVTVSGGGASAGVLTYTLTLTGTPTSTISAAHIHGGTATKGAAGTNAAVRVYLCGASAPSDNGVRTSGALQVCPAGAGKVTDTVTWPNGSTNVAGIAANPAANPPVAADFITFDQLVAAIKASNTYTNVHTATNGSGEIRGQLLPTPGLP